MVMREVANGWCVCGAVKFLYIETRQIILEASCLVRSSLLYSSESLLRVSGPGSSP